VSTLLGLFVRTVSGWVGGGLKKDHQHLLPPFLFAGKKTHLLLFSMPISPLYSFDSFDRTSLFFLVESSITVWL